MIWDINEHDQDEFRSMQDKFIRQKTAVIQLIAIEMQQALPQYGDAFAFMNRSLDISNGVSGRHGHCETLVLDMWTVFVQPDVDAYRFLGMNCCEHTGRIATGNAAKSHRHDKLEADCKDKVDGKNMSPLNKIVRLT